MSVSVVLFLAFGIGLVGGLRSMTAPAAVAWAAHLQWLPLGGSPMAFMGSRLAVSIFTASALMEFVADLLPIAPARITAFPLTARIAVGFLTGSCIGITGGISLWLGGTVGVLGALAGAFGGYHLRKNLVQALHVPDALIAISEDLVAVGIALLVITRFR